MTTVLKRGNTYHFSVKVGGERLRGSLGTRDRKSAYRLADRIGYAVSDGPDSVNWKSLRAALPVASYAALTQTIGVEAVPSLAEFELFYYNHLNRREKLKELAASTHQLYRLAAENLFAWLKAERIQELNQITPLVMEKYQSWRQGTARSQSKNGNGLKTYNTVMSSVFGLAVREGFIAKSPVILKFQSYGEPTEVHPFTSVQMADMQLTASGENLTAFLILKYTGLRASDVCALTWDAVDLQSDTIRWLTGKRKVWVTIPLAHELKSHLVARYERLQPDTKAPILGATDRRRIFSIIRNLGVRCGIKNCHPHRFRHTLAVTILEKGGSIYDVAQILGDRVATVEKHYAAFTNKLQERVRDMLNSKE